MKVLGFRDSESSKHKQRLIEQELQAPGACSELLATVAQVICFTLLSKWVPPKRSLNMVPFPHTKSNLIVASLWSLILPKKFSLSMVSFTVVVLGIQAVTLKGALIQPSASDAPRFKQSAQEMALHSLTSPERSKYANNGASGPKCHVYNGFCYPKPVWCCPTSTPKTRIWYIL